MGLTPAKRKEKVAKLREEHEDYFQTEGKINALYIPKMAYRPSGKDDLHVSFFPSELEKETDIYTDPMEMLSSNNLCIFQSGFSCAAIPASLSFLSLIHI